MDIRESTQLTEERKPLLTEERKPLLTEERKPLKLAEVLESSKKQFIRTMQKDIESLQKDQPAKPSMLKADQVKKAAPPTELPVVEPARRPVLPPSSSFRLKSAERLKKEAEIKKRIKETQKRLEEERMRAEVARQKAEREKVEERGKEAEKAEPVPPEKKPSFISRLFHRRPVKPPKPAVVKAPIPPKPIVPKPVLPPRSIPSEPVPPKLPTLPKPIPPKPVPLKKELPLEKEVKPAIKKSRLKFVFVGLAVILIIGGIGGFFYWWNYLRPVPPPLPPVTYYQCQDEQCIEVEGQGEDQCLNDEDCQIIEPTLPEPLMPVDQTETIELNIGQEDLLLEQLKSVAAQEQTQDTFKRILVKLISLTEKKYAQLDVLASDLGINIPTAILQAVAASEVEAGNYTLVLYGQAGGSRLGIIIDMGQSATLIQDLRNWEETIVADLKPMLLRNEIPAGFTEQFQDNTYQEVAIRYMNFPMPDLSLDYAIVDNKLIITTSRESMYATIDALVAVEAEIDTADWQTYQNEEYGFEMKYPANWGEATEEEKAQVSSVLAVFDMPVLDRDSLLEREIEASIDIFVLDNSEKKSLDSFTLEKTGGEIIVPKKNFEINGLKAIQVGYDWGVNVWQIWTVVELSLDKIAYIEFILVDPSDFRDDLDTFNQIFSTFKIY